MATQFEDFAAAGIDNFRESSPPLRVHSGDAEKLIEDGNVHVLKNFESQRKREDYARSQATRYKKELSLNMNTVDWSGFPGAAHKKTPASDDRKQRRGSGSHKDSEGVVLESTAKLDRRKQHRGMPRSMSPKQSYRSRRHLLGTGQTPPPVSESETVAGEKKSTRPGTSESTRKRTEMGSSGSYRFTRRASTQSIGRSQSQSKNLTRRPQTNPQRRSLSPSSTFGARNRHSSSPSGRLRRTVAAAASSTTLEVGADTQRCGSIPSRGSSRGRRKTKEKKATGEDDAARFHHGKSFQW